MTSAPETDISWDELHPETQRLLGRRSFLQTAGKSAVGVAVFGGFLTLVGCGHDRDKAGATGDPIPDPTTTTAAGAAGAPKKQPLYDRLGGNTAITAVIADFVDNNVAHDTRINHFFANTDLVRLKKLLVEFVDHATGGPEAYTGRDMKAAHAGLGITVADFNALVEDLVKSLDTFKVPEAEKQELLALLGPTQPDIATA
jgi:hemoglobin